jgi:hypothetical protein
LTKDPESLLGQKVFIPDRVVYREFPDETIVLNLDSGMYHGLNSTAARMLEVLAESSSVQVAIPALAGEFEQPEELIQRDILMLCQSLSERGLIVTEEDVTA